MDPQKHEENHHDTFKVKLALFFGYNGEKFQGMQYQREHTNTIQNILHAVLVENGFVLKSNATELKRIKWSRAARTDKKVHALCNGISMKLQIADRYVLDPTTKEINYNRIIKDINDQLPIDIKVLALRRVGKNFDMRHDAKTRIYNYIIPSKLFQPFEHFKQNRPVEGEALKILIESLNQLVGCYLGTHNFYNFTRGYKQTDPRCDRYMINMHVEQVEKTTVLKIIEECGKASQQEQPFIRFTLVGQSFIYHQIRKMIGLLIKIFSQGLNGEQTIKQAFKPEHFDTYLAPGEGLYLNRMTFESYNARKDTKQKLEFTEEEEERIRQYRAYLESKIIKHEVEEKIFSDWLLKRLDYDNKNENENGNGDGNEDQSDDDQSQVNSHSEKGQKRQKGRGRPNNRRGRWHGKKGRN